METIKIKPSHESQGEFVVINKDDFDTEKHELFDAVVHDADSPKKLSVGEIREALTAKGIEIPEGAKKAELQALLDTSE